MVVCEVAINVNIRMDVKTIPIRVYKFDFIVICFCDY